MSAGSRYAIPAPLSEITVCSSMRRVAGVDDWLAEWFERLAAAGYRHDTYAVFELSNDGRSRRFVATLKPCYRNEGASDNKACAVIADDHKR